MPQMAPMNWLILYFFFFIIFILFNIMNYYLFIPQNAQKMENKKNKQFSLNWKW